MPDPEKGRPTSSAPSCANGDSNQFAGSLKRRLGSEGSDNISLQDWRWTIDVNLMGVVHGVKAFLPLLQSHGEGGHIVNTASMAGFLPFGFGAYGATKFAVVGISEALATELEPQGIGVSVLCPGWVATLITESRRN